MVPALQPLHLHRGTKRTYRFALKSSLTGPAISLAGSSFSGQVRRSLNSAEMSLDLAPEVVDAAAGTLKFVVDDQDFSTIPSGLVEGVYDLLWTQADGERPKLLTGPVFVHGTSTQPLAD